MGGRTRRANRRAVATEPANQPKDRSKINNAGNSECLMKDQG